MSQIYFENNTDYALRAYDNPSMFNRDYYMLLLYCATHETVPAKMQHIKNEVGEANFYDLTIRMPWSSFKNSIKHSFEKIKTALLNATPDLLWRLPLAPLGVIGSIVMLPVNIVYGLLDTLSVKVGLYFLMKDFYRQLSTDMLERAAKKAMAVSFLTIPLRLPAGLVEAIQEPLHLYDFWIKGAVDAWHDYNDEIISKKVFAVRLVLHAFKVFCTLGAILSIIGITTLGILSKAFKELGKTAEYLVQAWDKIPGRRIFFEAPMDALRDFVVYIEKGVELIFGSNKSYFSEKANAHVAIELGFEACFTKMSSMLHEFRGKLTGFFDKRNPENHIDTKVVTPNQLALLEVASNSVVNSVSPESAVSKISVIAYDAPMANDVNQKFSKPNTVSAITDTRTRLATGLGLGQGLVR